MNQAPYTLGILGFDIIRSWTVQQVSIACFVMIRMPTPRPFLLTPKETAPESLPGQTFWTRAAQVPVKPQLKHFTVTSLCTANKKRCSSRASAVGTTVAENQVLRQWCSARRMHSSGSLSLKKQTGAGALLHSLKN